MKRYSRDHLPWGWIDWALLALAFVLMCFAHSQDTQAMNKTARVPPVMPHVVFKYAITLGEFVVKMPRYAQLLSAGYQQRGGITVWAQIDTGVEEVVHRRFMTVATGQTFLPQGVFVGTVFSGPYVWHVYDLGEDQP